METVLWERLFFFALGAFLGVTINSLINTIRERQKRIQSVSDMEKYSREINEEIDPIVRTRNGIRTQTFE